MDETHISPGGQTLAELALAREAIRHTMSVYNNAGDRGDFDAFAETFTPDGSLEVFGRLYQGRDAIRGFALSTAAARREAGRDSGKPYVRHHTTTSRIEVTAPEAASAWTYFIIFSDAAPPRTGMYVDSFVKAGGTWLIDTRRVKLDRE